MQTIDYTSADMATKLQYPEMLSLQSNIFL